MLAWASGRHPSALGACCKCWVVAGAAHRPAAHRRHTCLEQGGLAGAHAAHNGHQLAGGDRELGHAQLEGVVAVLEHSLRW